MRFLKDSWKSFLSGAFGAFVLLCIGAFVYNGLTPNTTSEKTDISQDVATRDTVPDGAKLSLPGAASGGHWHDGVWHPTSHAASTVRKKTLGEPSAAKLKRAPQRIGTPTLTQWKHHPHTMCTAPDLDLRELGLPQEKLERFVQVQAYGLTEEERDRAEAAGIPYEEAMLQTQVDTLTEGLDAASAFELLSHFPDVVYGKYTREYAQRALDENPDLLEARLYLVHKGPDDALAAAQYREILRDFPDSTGALIGLGVRLATDYPVEAIHHLKKANRINPEFGLRALGMAYQRLGDYKTAWTYLKKAQTYPHGPLTDRYVEAIEAGTPLIQPIWRTEREGPQDIAGDPNDIEALPLPENTDAVPEPSIDDIGDLLSPLPREGSEQETAEAERARAAAAAAKQAHEDFLKHAELSHKELNDFLQWAETILNADSPMDTNNFLMKEMEAHLKGGQAQFDPERIIRAFETLERYGPREGIKRLQKNDPDVAKQVQRLLTEKRPARQR